MKRISDIKPLPTSRIGLWRAWRNHMRAVFISIGGKKIKVKEQV